MTELVNEFLAIVDTLVWAILSECLTEDGSEHRLGNENHGGVALRWSWCF